MKLQVRARDKKGRFAKVDGRKNLIYTATTDEGIVKKWSGRITKKEYKLLTKTKFREIEPDKFEKYDLFSNILQTQKTYKGQSIQQKFKRIKLVKAKIKDEPDEVYQDLFQRSKGTIDEFKSEKFIYDVEHYLNTDQLFKAVSLIKQHYNKLTGKQKLWYSLTSKWKLGKKTGYRKHFSVTAKGKDKSQLQEMLSQLENIVKEAMKIQSQYGIARRKYQIEVIVKDK